MHYTQKDIIRFYNKINVIENGPNKDCWEINYKRDKYGYTNFSLNQHPYKSHRFMYQIHHPNEIIFGLHICHTCDHPWCINPEHLFAGTAYDNVKDKMSKGRQSRGESHGLSKINDKNVLEMLNGILTNKFKSISEIRNYFSVSQYVIGKILNGQTRQHLTDNFDLDLLKSKLEYSQLGVNGSRSKFTNDQILNIRKTYIDGETITNLAKKYNVDHKTIYSIIRNKSYINVI